MADYQQGQPSFYPKLNKMFRAIVETTPDTIIIADSQNQIIFCNEKIRETFGYEPAELLNQNLAMIIPAEFREGHKRGVQRLLETKTPQIIGQTVELLGLRKDGTRFPIDLSLSYWEENGAMYFSSIIRDITKRKNEENNLMRERQYLRTILETVEEGIIACDEEGYLTFFNRAASRLFGESLPKDFYDFDDRVRNFNLYFPDGRNLHKKEELPLYRVLQGNEFTSEEMEIRFPGKDKVVVLITGRRIRTATGLNLGAVAIFHDITAIRLKEEELKEKNRFILRALEELKLAEQNLVQVNSELEQRVAERTTQLQKINQELNLKNSELQKINADLDNFVYIASHDLKAPLLNFEALLNLLKQELPAEFHDREKEIIPRLEKSIQEMKQNIYDIANIAKVQRQEQLPAEWVAIADVFQEIKSSVGELIQEAGALIETDFSQAPDVYFAPVNLKSILINLISNAIKYRSPERKLLIQVSSYRQNAFVVLEVKDNGLGIDLAKSGKKLFSMFTRLHSHVEGSGIGLYIVKRIVENNQGRVEVDSQVGEGTTFRVYLHQPGAII